MRRIMFLLFIVFFTPSILFAADGAGADNPAGNLTTEDIKQFKTQGDYSDVKEFLLQSIAGRGIKISSTSHISMMLNRTREAVGGEKQIFKNAEAIGFCSATLSRKMMESNPHHIVFCPYTVVIYELTEQPGTIFLAYRRPFYRDSSANDETLNDIDNLLSSIIAETLE